MTTTPVSRHLLLGGSLIQAEIRSEPKAGCFWLPPSHAVHLYPINSWCYAWSPQSHNLPSPVGQSSSVRGTAGDTMGVWPPHAGKVPAEGHCEASAPQRAVLATGGTPAGPGPVLRPLTPPAQPGPRPHTADMLGDPEPGGRGSRGPFSRSPLTPGGIAGEGFTSTVGPGDQEAPEQRGQLFPQQLAFPPGSMACRSPANLSPPLSCPLRGAGTAIFLVVTVAM